MEVKHLEKKMWFTPWTVALHVKKSTSMEYYTVQ